MSWYTAYLLRVIILLQEFQEVLTELAKDKSMDAFRGEYEKLFNTLEKSNKNEKRLRTKAETLDTAEYLIIFKWNCKLASRGKYPIQNGTF